MRKTALALVAVLMLSLLSGMPVAASPDDATNDTVVVAVGDADSALLAANAIASANDYTVVQADTDGLDVQAVQTLSERGDNGNLDEAIVVGDDLDTTVADLEDLDIHVTEIQADEDRHLFYESTLQNWESADSAVLTSKVGDDRATVSAALANADLGPVLEQSVGVDDVQSAFDSLGVETVYVTPGVSDSTIAELNETYTVDEATLAGSPQAVASELAQDTEHVAVTHPTLVHHASQVGAGDNTSLLVTEDDELGAAVTDSLENWQNTTDVYATYDPVAVQSHTNASVTAINEYHDLRLGLLVSHEYGVLVSEVDDQGNGHFDIEIQNIGFSTVAGPNDVAATATWTGTNIDSDPSGANTDDGYVVEYTGELEPGDTWAIELTADEINNGAHPDLDYYVETSTGGLLSGSNAVDLSDISFLQSTWHVVLVGLASATVLSAVIWATWTNRRQT